LNPSTTDWNPAIKEIGFGCKHLLRKHLSPRGAENLASTTYVVRKTASF
jgi:hypothetical protein